MIARPPLHFHDSVTVEQSDGSTCTAVYTIDTGTGSLDCPCTEPLACTAADRYLTAKAKACGVRQ